jgi:HSP20 family protein
MAKVVKKEKDTKAVAVRKPAELVSRGSELDQWFDRMAEDMWRRPFPSLPSLLGREHWWPAPTMAMRVPSLDVFEEKDEVVIKAELPGMKKEEIEVTVSGDGVTIKGEKKQEEEVKEKDYYRRERSYGSFSRSVTLPCEVKGDEVKASFKDGVLEVRMPKTEEAKAKAVTVKID